MNPPHVEVIKAKRGRRARPVSPPPPEARQHQAPDISSFFRPKSPDGPPPPLAFRPKSPDGPPPSHRPKSPDGPPPPPPPPPPPSTVAYLPEKKGGKQGGHHNNHKPRGNVILQLQCSRADLEPKEKPASACLPLPAPQAPPPPSVASSLWTKMKHLSLDLHTGRSADTTTSCCFWDTCAFDGPSFYLPVHIAPDGTFLVYGHFCCPACAVAHLLREPINESVRAERLQLFYHSLGLHQPVRPAIDPHYTLDKFGGTLTIEEYRQANASATPFSLIARPTTRYFPELIEDGDSCIRMPFVAQRNGNDILREKFNPQHSFSSSP